PCGDVVWATAQGRRLARNGPPEPCPARECGSLPGRRSIGSMATFVLVHGGWAGGWQWRQVAARLEAGGHTALCPTLTGCGERVHLAHPQIDLDLHAQDIVNVLEYEDLHDVVLVGHSYGGMVITNVAERAPHRLRRLVFLDAF